MNAKISVFVIWVEAIIYLLLYNLHDCAFKNEQKGFLSSNEIKKKLTNNLSVFLDQNGLLRVEESLKYSLHTKLNF